MYQEALSFQSAGQCTDIAFWLQELLQSLEGPGLSSRPGGVHDLAIGPPSASVLEKLIRLFLDLAGPLAPGGEPVQGLSRAGRGREALLGRMR